MYCPNCFSVLQPGVTRCSHCSFDTREYAHSTDALPLYTSLNDQYMIGRVLGQGGFGITYKALDTFKNRVVAIKEYMPSNYAQRTGCQVVPIPGDTKAARIFERGKISYIDEIKTLYQFENVQGIVQIFTHFQENNTAYLVMEYLDGCNLKAYVKSHGGRLDPALAGNYIVKAARALQQVHAGHILHRDISPENIYILFGGTEIKLIDFGAARKCVEDSEQENSVLLKPGFAPPEQYSKNGNQNTWTDVYALAATLYYIVSGKVPQDSLSRMQADQLQPLDQMGLPISASMAQAVRHALEIDYAKRTQTCTQFIDELVCGGWTERTIPQPPPNPPALPTCIVTCVAGTNVGQRVWFKPGETVSVGRLAACNALVPSTDMIISKRHCLITYNAQKQRFIVTDVSTNGTYMQNGKRLRYNQPEQIVPGSILYLAREHINIQLVAT